MSLSRFALVMPRAVEAVLSTAEALRYVRDTQGDLTFRALDRVQDCLALTKGLCLEALSEGMRQPATSEAFMASMGGPETLAEFQVSLGACEVAAAGWNALLASFLTGLSGDELIAVVRRGEGVAGTSHIEPVPFITAARAGTLRGSTQLAALISAFEAVGA